MRPASVLCPWYCTHCCLFVWHIFIISLSSLFLWQFSPWHTDRSLHYAPIHASYSQILGGELPAPLHQEGTQPPIGLMGCTMVFLPSLELERALPIRLDKNKIKLNAVRIHRARPYLLPFCRPCSPDCLNNACHSQHSRDPCTRLCRTLGLCYNQMCPTSAHSTCLQTPSGTPFCMSCSSVRLSRSVCETPFNP